MKKIKMKNGFIELKPVGSYLLSNADYEAMSVELKKEILEVYRMLTFNDETIPSGYYLLISREDIPDPYDPNDLPVDAMVDFWSKWAFSL